MATKFEKLIQELKSKRGRHTELVSVYVPVDYDLNQIANQLRTEAGTAENIKSKATRKNVVAALEKCVQHLKLYKETPKNGLVLFCGNVSEQEGAAEIDLWAFEPPQPLHQKLYWCDQRFVLDPLEGMTRSSEVYGLLLFDKSECDVGFLRGKRIVSAKHMESIVPGKTRAGGQSSARFGRVREALLNDWLKEIAESAEQIFLPELKNLKGIIVGGPGPVKEQFMKEKQLHYELEKKVIGIVSVGYTGEPGLQELVERSKDLLAEAEVTKEKAVMQKFFDELKKDSGMATYGVEQVRKSIESGAAETVLVSEDAEWKAVELLCPNGHGEARLVRASKMNEQACNICKQNMKLMGQKDIDEYFDELTKTTGATMIPISRDTMEGEQLFQMGGVAALLRYKTY